MIPGGVKLFDKVSYISQGDKMNIRFLHKVESKSYVIEDSMVQRLSHLLYTKKVSGSIMGGIINLDNVWNISQGENSEN